MTSLSTILCIHSPQPCSSRKDHCKCQLCISNFKNGSLLVVVWPLEQGIAQTLPTSLRTEDHISKKEPKCASHVSATPEGPGKNRQTLSYERPTCLPMSRLPLCPYVALTATESDGTPLMEQYVPCPVCETSRAQHTNPSEKSEGVQYFDMEDCVLTAIEQDFISCPRHPDLPVPLQELVPELFMTDFPARYDTAPHCTAAPLGWQQLLQPLVPTQSQVTFRSLPRLPKGL